MTALAPRVFTIPPGVPFLPTLATALSEGRVVPGFTSGDDPLALADVTIFVPTRRAARELRAIFAGMQNGRAAILPVIRPLGDFDEDAAWFDEALPPFDHIDPPIDSRERLLLLAPLVQVWKRRLPAHIASMFAEQVVVPSSSAEAIWLARDLASLMDEIETQESDWSRLDGLVDAELAGWWQVTLDFLKIVTSAWPDALQEMKRSNPAAHRSLMIDAEAGRLKRQPPKGPIVAAGSTGSIPATARLLQTIASLPNGAVVLPGLDLRLDAAGWAKLDDVARTPSVAGHPQFGLHKLMATIGVERRDIAELVPEPPAMAARATLISEALRPAETTDQWTDERAIVAGALALGALDDVMLVEAPNEREEALAIALALRQSAAKDRRAALVTPDRALARRVSSELQRFGVDVDDSAGSPLTSCLPASFMALLVEAAMRPGDPVSVLSFLKHPLLTVGMERGTVRRAVELIELAALRGGVGRPDLCRLGELFSEGLTRDRGPREPRWLKQRAGEIEPTNLIVRRIVEAIGPLAKMRDEGTASIAALAAATAQAFEAVGRSADGSVTSLYRGEAGNKLADVLRSLVGSTAALAIAPADWPDVLAALLDGETVKPRHAREGAVSIWGALEARLLHVDLIICGGLNEGTWPVRTDPGGFMSRMMKTDLALDPPERRIGQAAHDFMMAMGQPQVVLTRALRTADAPSVPSRWVQRLTAFVGEDATSAMRRRGDTQLAAARHYAGDAPKSVDFAPRPDQKPPVEARPKHFSVTEIETLRRDPYAIYARKVLRLEALDELLRDPGASERGSLFHDILHRFTLSGIDAGAPDALDSLLAIARQCFDEEELPADVDAVWWPRFRLMAPNLLDWEIKRSAEKLSSLAEANAEKREVGETGVTLSGRADRIDIMHGGVADILDYKTGTTPSKTQAHTLVAPQLALEGALMWRQAFAFGKMTPGELAYVRLRASGEVDEESILEIKGAKKSLKSALELSEEAWKRLEALLTAYNNRNKGYLSRALPFREGDTDGDYDHLARVHEWSAGGDAGEEGGDE